MIAEYASQTSIGDSFNRKPRSAVSAQAASTPGMARTIAAKARRQRLK
jgi:hypothetical protein